MSRSELLCIGLSHQTAPLGVRERLAIDETRQRSELEVLARNGLEALWLSTCNRVEVYVSAAEEAAARAMVHERLSSAGGPETLAHLYEHRGEAALLALGAGACATGASEWTSSAPCLASSTVRKNGEATASGTIVEQTSWRKPGSVSSSVRVPPPIVVAAS